MEATSERSERVKIPLVCVRACVRGRAYKGDSLGKPLYKGVSLLYDWKSHSGITVPLFVAG